MSERVCCCSSSWRRAARSWCQRRRTTRERCCGRTRSPPRPAAYDASLEPVVRLRGRRRRRRVPHELLGVIGVPWWLRRIRNRHHQQNMMELLLMLVNHFANTVTNVVVVMSYALPDARNIMHIASPMSTHASTIQRRRVLICITRL